MADESQLEQSRAYFFRNYTYTKEKLARDYQAELSAYRDDNWEAPQRAARLSAAVKRYKTYRMLCFIFDIADDIQLDFTPIVVKRLCAALFGRVGSQDIIVDIFGQKGRSHRSRDSSPAVIGDVASRYRLKAWSWQAATLSDIAEVKRDYSRHVRSARKKTES